MFPASLVETSAELHTGELDLLTYINQLCDLIDASEPHIQALLPEAGRRARLLHEAQELQMRFPRPREPSSIVWHSSSNKRYFSR